MDALKIMTRFQKFEAEMGVFDQLVDGSPWWDTVRYDVYNFLGQLLLGRGLAAASPPLWRRMAGDARRSMARWKLLHELRRKNKSVLLIRAPRVRHHDGYIDSVVDPIGALFPGETNAIDTIPKRYHVPVIQKSTRSGSVPQDLEKIVSALLDIFAIPGSAANSLEKTIRLRRLIYEAELRGYDQLLKAARPRTVVLVQNGIEKALFTAAHRLGVPTVEIQHGLIGYTHAAYSYSPDINYSAQSTFPDLFLTFSEHWNTACHYPATACVPVGNERYFVQPMPASVSGAAMVISADIYHHTLANWVRAISALSPQRRILYKLHPNQTPNAKQISDEFVNLPNVEVVTGQTPASTLLKDVSHVIAVCSTVAYEALQAGRTVCIIPEQDYLSHKDILHLPGVVVTETPEELDRALDVGNAKAEAPRFFDPFNSDRARSAIEETIRQGQIHWDKTS